MTCDQPTGVVKSAAIRAQFKPKDCASSRVLPEAAALRRPSCRLHSACDRLRGNFCQTRLRKGALATRVAHTFFLRRGVCDTSREARVRGPDVIDFISFHSLLPGLQFCGRRAAVAITFIQSTRVTLGRRKMLSESNECVSSVKCV